MRVANKLPLQMRVAKKLQTQIVALSATSAFNPSA
jgi:hypothetical protein